MPLPLDNGKSNMKKFISFSGGVESTTMCILYGKGATAIWCDTGWEHDEMYERIDYCEKRLTELHEGDFELVRITPKVVAKDSIVNTLQEYIIKMMFMPSKQARFCTDRFKITPIDNFLIEQGECELMIGFNADEEPSADRTGNFMKCKNVKYTYPLYDEEYDRKDCEEILYKHNLHPAFPIYMQRGGCEGCIFKSIAEYKALYFFSRKAFDRNKALEESVQDKRKKYFTISISGRSFAEIQEECEMEVRQWGLDEVEKMYKKTKPSQSCGPFCHR